MTMKTDVREMIKTNVKKRKQITDKVMPSIFLMAALVSVVTTAGIVMTLIRSSFLM